MKYELNSLSEALHEIADSDIEIIEFQLLTDEQTEIRFSVCGKPFPVKAFSWALLPNKSECIKELYSSIVRPEVAQFADEIGDFLVGRGCDIRLDSYVYHPETDTRFDDVSPAMRGAVKNLSQWRRRTLDDPGYHVPGDEWEEVGPAVEVLGDRVFLASKNPLDLVELGTSVTKFDNFFKEHFSFKLTEKYPGVVLGKNAQEQYICTASLGYIMASFLLKSGYDSILISDDAVNTRACLIIDPSIIVSTLNGQTLGEQVFTPFPHHMASTIESRSGQVIEEGIAFDDKVARIEQMEKLSNEIVRASAHLLPLGVDIEPVASPSLETLPTGAEVHGSYSRNGVNQIVKIALEGEPFKALHHETIHALKEGNLFTDKEWSTLEATAQENGWIGKFGIAKRYPKLQEKELLVESIADGFAYWMSNPKAVKTLIKDSESASVVTRMFNGFRNLLHMVSTKLGVAGHDTTTAISVFSDVSSGKISERESDFIASKDTVVKHTVGVPRRTGLQILHDRKLAQEGKDNEIKKHEVGEKANAYSRFAFGEVERETKATLGNWIAEPGGTNSLRSCPTSGEQGDVPTKRPLQPRGYLSKKINMLERGGIKTSALSISDEFIQRGWVDLRGQKITTPNDFANLVAIYRSPQFETVRIFLTQGDNVVSHWGITSRCVNGVVLYDKKGKFIPQTIERMKRSGADGYFLSHNHPTGSSCPSENDIDCTRDIAKKIPGFRGHVVTNGKSYHLIEANGNAKRFPYKGSYKNNSHLESMIPFPMNNKNAGASVFISDFTRYLRDDEDQVSLIFLSNEFKVRAVQEVPRKFFEKTDQMVGYIRNRSLEFGSFQILSYTGYCGTSDAIMQTVRKLWREDLLADHKFSKADGTCVDSLKIMPWEVKDIGGVRKKRIQVNEAKNNHHGKKTSHVANECSAGI